MFQPIYHYRVTSIEESKFGNPDLDFQNISKYLESLVTLKKQMPTKKYFRMANSFLNDVQIQRLLHLNSLSK